MASKTTMKEVPGGIFTLNWSCMSCSKQACIQFLTLTPKEYHTGVRIGPIWTKWPSLFQRSWGQLSWSLNLNVTLQVLVTSQASSLQSSESYKVYMYVSICTAVHPQEEQFVKVTGTREHLWSVCCFDYCWGPTCGSALRCRDLDQRRHPRFQARSPSSGTMWDLDWMILEWFINASSCHDL